MMLLDTNTFLAAVLSTSKRVGGATLLNTVRGVPETARRFTTPWPAAAGTSTAMVAALTVTAVVATGGLCKSSMEKVAALVSALVPYWPANTDETALMVQVVFGPLETMLVIESMPTKLKSTPSVRDRVEQSTGRVEVSVKTRLRSVSVDEGAVSVSTLRLPSTTNAAFRDRDPMAPMAGRVSVAELLAASPIEPPFRTSALTLE